MKKLPTDTLALPLKDILFPLRDAVQQICGRHDLGMNEMGEVSGSRALYALTGPGTVPAQTDRVCMLNRLYPKTNPDLWFGILLELKKRIREVPTAQDVYEVFHVSIQAFEGITSQTLEPLLRAEWDTGIARSKVGPAQPHWHAYAASLKKLDGLMPESYHNYSGQLATDNIKQRQHKMHFALCANWHKKMVRSLKC